MKRFIIFLICLFSFLPILYSQNWYNARKDSKLLGPVKTCKHIFSSTTSDSSVYLQDGKLKYQKHETQSDITESFYDDEGRIISSIETSKKYNDVYKVQYTYIDNKVTVKSYYEGQSSTETYSQNHYNSMGLPVKEYSSSNTWTAYEYDKLGNLTKELFYDLGTLDSYFTLKYDSNSRLIERKDYEGNKLDFKMTYKYSGNIVEVKEYDATGNLCGEHSYKTDKMGNIIEYSSINYSNGRKNYYTAVYYYDSYGNWVYKKIDNTTGGYEESREITYY